MIGAVVRTCAGCGGNGAYWPNNTPCAYCASSGETVVCLGCGREMPLPEAKRHGAYCTPCREAADIPEQLEESA